jgi:tetratricopeptide (TPR) repeat protein
MTKLRKATATLTPLAPSPAPAVAGLPRWVLITGALVAALASAGAAVAQTDVSGSNTVSVDQVQHNLSIDQDRIGDAQRAQGDLSAALKSYQASMEIRRKLAERDPGNAQWQRDLSVSHNKIGDVQSAQGDLGGALKSFQADMEIARKLAERDPGNAEWQRDLSVSHDRIGEVQSAQGDLGGALKSFQASMEIARKLAERDPGNAQWQTDLAFSCWKLSQLDTPALPKAERRALLKRGLAVLERLQQRGQLTPDKQTWPEAFRQALQKLAR